MLQKLLSRVRKAVSDYDMIKEGDKIAVGVSGGKDSISLLYCLNALKDFYPEKFSIVAITLSLGNPGFDIDAIIDLYNRLEVPYHIEETNIAKIVFDVRQEKNPCSLCSNMKRGAFYNTAKKLGCNKAAFGHHKDDVIETLLLSLFYEGRVNTFSPVTYLDRKDITLIRPLIYVEEKMIRSFVKSENIIPIKSGCRADNMTKRKFVKDYIHEIMKDNPKVKDNMFGAIMRNGMNGWHLPR